MKKSVFSTLMIMAVLLGCSAIRAQALTFEVTSNADTMANGTLRKAIVDANTITGYHTIHVDFDLSITLSSALPDITKKVDIMGYNPGGGTAWPIIDGVNKSLTLMHVARGVASSADGSTISLITMLRGNCGILIDVNNVSLEVAALGTTGSTGSGNVIGVSVSGSGNSISASTISGNVVGIQLTGNNNFVYNNNIGTYNGSVLVPNTGDGIEVIGYYNHIFGGNIISGNGQLGGYQSGIYVGGHDNTVCGNYIGTNSSGASLGNTHYGVYVTGYRNFIGLPSANMENVIGYNQTGIYINNLYFAYPNIVQNNYIGTDTSFANCGNAVGILVAGTYGNIIGGLRGSGLDSNTIGWNTDAGIRVSNAGNTISGNYIGCNAAGTKIQNNNGIDIQGSNNLIGGSNPGGGLYYGNVIAGNSLYGILDSGGFRNTVAGNSIGITAAGGALGNAAGIYLNYGSHGDLIGGNAPGVRNIISGNTVGLQIYSAYNHKVKGNYFGSNEAGTSEIANTNASMMLDTALGCQIGGYNPGEGNILTGRDDGGVGAIYFNFCQGNTVIGNWIGLLPNGAAALNGQSIGIELFHSPNNSIGTRGNFPGNLIYGGTTSIYLDGSAGNTNGNGFYSNTLCGFSSAGITLDFGANLGKTPPTITGATTHVITGNCTAHDRVDVYLASRGGGVAGGSLKYVGSATNTGGGTWNANVSALTLTGGEYVCAVASDASNNTSPFSTNFSVPMPTATPTITPTCTVTATPTVSPTLTQSPVFTATATVTPTITGTLTPIFTVNHFDLAGKTILAYPNPGQGKITFIFQLDKPATVTLTLFNTVGERVGFIEDSLPNGLQALVWNCEGIAPGIYLARVKQEGKEIAKLKVCIIR
jgi:hypothetical protein